MASWLWERRYGSVCPLRLWGSQDYDTRQGGVEGFPQPVGASCSVLPPLAHDSLRTAAPPAAMSWPLSEAPCASLRLGAQHEEAEQTPLVFSFP